jgi:hypothetical protein
VRHIQSTKILARICIYCLLVAGFVTLIPQFQSADVSAASSTPICSTTQLTLAVETGTGAYSAAGNHGVAFALINISHAACSLEGYPKLEFYPSIYKGKIVKTTENGGGQIFAAVKPGRTIIGPGATASYGINYGDAYNQGDPNAGPCMTQSVTALFPVRVHPYSVPFTVPLELNFCFANFHFGVTSIQAGPLPKTN